MLNRITPTRIQRALQNRVGSIRGLTPSRLANAIDLFHSGYLRECAILWDAIERRDLMLRNVALKRKKAVSKLRWEVLVTDDSLEAKAHQAALLFFYNNVSATNVLNFSEQGGFSLLLRQMMDAIGKGFAVHEITWSPRRTASGEIKLTADFRFCPLWFFEHLTGKLRFLPAESYGEGGIEMQPGEWLVTIAEGLMEASSVAFLYKNLALKDWLSFCEKFGFPGVLGKTDAPRDSDSWKAMEEAVRNFMNDWAAVASRTDEISLIETQKTGTAIPFPSFVDYMDRQVAALWRGADLSTISQGGAGRGASLQGDEQSLLVDDDAELMGETLNYSIDPFVIRYTFGDVRPKAYIKILPPARDRTMTDLKIDEFLLASGVPVAMNDTLERYGRSAAKEGEPTLKRPIQGGQHGV